MHGTRRTLSIVFYLRIYLKQSSSFIQWDAPGLGTHLLSLPGILTLLFEEAACSECFPAKLGLHPEVVLAPSLGRFAYYQ